MLYAICNEERAPDQNESSEHRFHYAMSRIAMAAHASRWYKQKERRVRKGDESSRMLSQCIFSEQMFIC